MEDPDAARLGFEAWLKHLSQRHRFIDSDIPTRQEYDRWLEAEASKAVAVVAPSDGSLACPLAADAVPAAPPLALPAPEDVAKLITLNVGSGEAVVLDQLGPVVVNTDGTLSRITNWPTMTDGEKENAKRLIAKRNIKRLRTFQEEGTLKSELFSALEPKSDT